MHGTDPSAVAGHAGPVPEPDSAEDAVMSTMMALGRRMRQRYEGDQVDFSAIPVIKVLTHRGAQRLSTLAGILGLDASTVSRHVKQLEDRGLVERTGDPADGRAFRVGISDAGSRCLAQGVAVRRGVITAALADWDDADRETLRRLLHRLVTGLLDAGDAPGTTARTTAPTTSTEKQETPA
jgi:DNA-binding MarR family transcriptional regulator